MTKKRWLKRNTGENDSDSVQERAAKFREMIAKGAKANQEKCIFLGKIAIAGEGATGTTSICHYLSTGEFLPDYPERTPYIGTRFWITTIKTSAYDDPIKFQIWGRRRGIHCFPENMATSFRGIKGLILVYDITRKRTFEELPRWLDTALQYASNFPVAIFGNKVDLIGKTAEERRQYYASEEIIDPRTGILFAESIADEYDVPTLFMETSAKTGENIHRLFSEFTEMIADHRKIKLKAD